MMPTWAISLVPGNGLRARLEVLDDLDDGEVDAALQVHRVHAGRDRLHALANDRLRQNGRGGRAVAGDVVGLRGDFAQHLRAHVLELVLELDFLGDGDAVLGDARCAEALVDDDVAALRTQGHLHRVGEDVDAAQDALTGVAAEFHVFGCHVATLSIEVRKFTHVATIGRSKRLADDPEDVGFLHDEEVLAVDLDLGARPFAEQDLVAGLDVERVILPFSARVPVPTATTSPSCGFSLAVSGMMIPPADFSSASTRRTSTRS